MQSWYVSRDTPRRGEEAEPELTLLELDRAFRSWLLTAYLPRPHGQTGLPPIERWAAEGFYPELPEPVERLDLLLSTEARTRRVRRDGIHFHALRYLDAVLAAYVGEDVLVRYDPTDLAEMRVYHEGRFLCRAVCPELSGETVGLKEIRNVRNRRRRELRKRVRDRRAVVDELVALRRGERAETPEETPEGLPPEVAEDENPLKLYENDRIADRHAVWPADPKRVRGHEGPRTRFESFCDDVARYRCIGVCVGPARVGKTASARRYTLWDALESRYPRFCHTEKPPPEAALVRSVFCTRPVVSRPRLIASEVEAKRNLVDWLAAVASQDGDAGAATEPRNRYDSGLPEEHDRMRLLVVDEANWLKMPDLEQLRSMRDREGFGLVLLGMPGLEKSLACYPQLYSRVGFVHRYAPLRAEETEAVVTDHAVGAFGLSLPPEAFADRGGVSALVRESRGSFRLLEKLLQQCERVMRINGLSKVDARVVETARKALTFGET